MVFSIYLGKRHIKTADENIVTLNKLSNASSKVRLKKYLHLRGRQVLRSAYEKFSFNSSCSFCSQPAMMGSKRKGFDIIPVKTIELKDIFLTVVSGKK